MVYMFCYKVPTYFLVYFHRNITRIEQGIIQVGHLPDSLWTSFFINLFPEQTVFWFYTEIKYFVISATFFFTNFTLFSLTLSFVCSSLIRFLLLHFFYYFSYFPLSYEWIRLRFLVWLVKMVSEDYESLSLHFYWQFTV